MAILLKILAKALKEYDRTQLERDAMWETIWTKLDDGRKAFDAAFKAFQDAEVAARRKLGEAMWLEPTNINSYDKCMMLDSDTARKWVKTTVAEHEKWVKKYPETAVELLQHRQKPPRAKKCRVT